MPGRGGAETGGFCDHPNFPGMPVVGPSDDMVGATVVAPPRDPPLLLAAPGSGSAAMAFNVRPSVAVLTQSLPKLQNFKNDRNDLGEGGAINDFDPVLAA